MSAGSKLGSVSGGSATPDRGITYTYVDAAARVAETGLPITAELIADQVIVRQADDNSLWTPTGAPGAVVWVSVGGGSGSGDLSYVHTQAVASTTWTVNHNLGRRVAATVLTVGGREVLAEVQHINVNQLVVYPKDPLAGSVICS